MQSYVAENFWNRAASCGASAFDRTLFEEAIDEAFGFSSSVFGVAVEVFATPPAKGLADLVVHDAREVGHHHTGQALVEGPVQLGDAVAEFDGGANLATVQVGIRFIPLHGLHEALPHEHRQKMRVDEGMVRMGRHAEPQRWSYRYWGQVSMGKILFLGHR